MVSNREYEIKQQPVNYVIMGEEIYPEDALFVNVDEIRRQRDREWNALKAKMLKQTE